MERRFEEELAALRLRRSFLKQVQEKTEAIMTTNSTVQSEPVHEKENSCHMPTRKPSPEKITAENSPQKSLNFSASSVVAENFAVRLPAKPSCHESSQKSSNLQSNSAAIARDSLSSPGVTSIISVSNTALPPGFDGSSVPLIPTAAMQRPIQIKERDPFDPPEKLPSFLIPTKAPLDGFVEGQLISLSISSHNSSVHGDDDFNNEKMMEELKMAFEQHQKDVQTMAEEKESCSRDAELDETKTKSDEQNLTPDEISSRINLMEDASNTPSLMEKFLNSHCDDSDILVSPDTTQNMSTFRNELVSPNFTETSGEYRIGDRASTGNELEDDEVPESRHLETDLDGVIPQQPPVLSAASEIKRSGNLGVLTKVSVSSEPKAKPLNVPNRRSFEEKNNLIQNISASSPDANIAISQYRGINQMGEEDELLTVEAELPCDFPR